MEETVEVTTCKWVAVDGVLPPRQHYSFLLTLPIQKTERYLKELRKTNADWLTPI